MILMSSFMLLPIYNKQQTLAKKCIYFQIIWFDIIISQMQKSFFLNPAISFLERRSWASDTMVND